jgi:hypothetical protein
MFDFGTVVPLAGTAVFFIVQTPSRQGQDRTKGEKSEEQR